MAAKKEKEIENEIVITGEQMENAMVICNKYGKYNDFFIDDLEGVDIDDYELFENARKKIVTREKRNDEEKRVWDNFIAVKKEIKSKIILNPDMARELWKVLGDETDYNITTSPDIIIRGLAFTKNAIGL